MPLLPQRLALVGVLGAPLLLVVLRARLRQTSRRALALLKTVDSQVLEAELERRRVGSHVFNTTVRPLHPLRAKLLDAELLKLGVNVHDDLAPGPPRKAYDSFARPRDGEPCDDDFVTKKAPLVAQQVAFLHRHELARRNELLRNVDDAERALANARRPRHNVTVVLDNLRSAENVGSIFRTADAARASIVTCGFTTTPPDRKLEKTALGAISSVPCTHYDGTLQAVRALRGLRYRGGRSSPPPAPPAPPAPASPPAAHRCASYAPAASTSSRSRRPTMRCRSAQRRSWATRRGASRSYWATR